MRTLTPKERLTRQALGQEVDRIPAIGGWIGGTRVLAALAGISTDAYLADPLRGMLQAHHRLGVDGLVSPIYPTELDQMRTGSVTEEKYRDVEPEALVEVADKLPDTEQGVLATFDGAAAERRYRECFESAQAGWGGLARVPNFWEIGGPFPLYHQFGYVAFLTACATYPEAVRKIWWARSLAPRECAKILARLYKEYDLVPLMFCGEDLCNNQGPMASPAFLRQHYLPLVQEIIAPLVESGVRVIHHCDGDVRPLLADFLRIGFSGLQGFQYELGLEIPALRALRDACGRELLFFTGLSVSRTLPFGTVQEVRDEVDYFMDATEGGRGMFLFTSNVTGVEVPPENLREAYARVRTRVPYTMPAAPHRSWPWTRQHPGDALAGA